MGTFSKSLASVGGFIAGERCRDRLSEAHGASLRVFREPAGGVGGGGGRRAPDHDARSRSAAAPSRDRQMLRDELRARGFNVLPGETPIVPVVIQDEMDLCRLCKALLEEGIYINPVLRPAAAQNLLRISCTAAHTEAHVDRLVTTLERISTGLGIER